MSRIGQGSGLAAPTTTFQSKLRRPGQSSTAAAAASSNNPTTSVTTTTTSANLASQLTKPSSGSTNNNSQAGRRNTEAQQQLSKPTSATAAASNNTTTASKPAISSGPAGVLSQNTTQATNVAKQNTKVQQAQATSATSRTTFLNRPAAEKQVAHSVSMMATKTAANQSQQTTKVANAGAATSSASGIQQRRSTLVQPLTGAAKKEQQASAAQNSSVKAKETSGLASGNQPKSQQQSTTSFGFVRQRATIGSGINKVSSQPTTALTGTKVAGPVSGSQSNSMAQAQPTMANSRHSMALPTTSALAQSKTAQPAGSTSKFASGSSSAIPSQSTLASKQQTGIQRPSRASLVTSSSTATSSLQQAQPAAATSAAAAQGRISRIGKGGLKHQPSAEVVAAAATKKVGPRGTATDKISVSPKLLKQQSLKAPSKIGGGSNVPSFNVALENKSAASQRRVTQVQTKPHAPPLEKKLPSFDLKTPQRMNLRPPQPTESVTNPALLENTTPEQKSLAAGALIVSETNVVEKTPGTGSSIKYREPPSEEPPMPQRQSDFVQKQASPIQRPINSAQKTAAAAPSQTINLFQRQHSKLADLRQRKTLILQNSGLNSEDSKKQREQQLQQITQLQSVIKQQTRPTGQDSYIGPGQTSSEQARFLQQHANSKSDVAVVNDFTLVDSQLATIKEQLEQSKQRNPLLAPASAGSLCDATPPLALQPQHSVVQEEASAENLESFLMQEEDISEEHHQRPVGKQIVPQVHEAPPFATESITKPTYARQASNSTPQQARTSNIPTMVEPDPCPFEQAQSSEEGREQDIDLLADINDNKGSKHQDTDKNASDEQIACAKRLSFLDSVKDSDQCPSKESEAQDMVEPMDAPHDRSKTYSDEAANVSADEKDDDQKINLIGATKEYNLMLGFNHRQDDSRVPQKLEDNYMIEAVQGKQPREVPLDLSRMNQHPATDNRVYENNPVSDTLKPEQSVTPRDWTGDRQQERRIARRSNGPEPHQSFAQSYVLDKDQPASLMDGIKSRSHVNLDATQSLHARRNMRQSVKISGSMTGHQINSQSQSFSQQIQDLNLETKLKNLQESISHLPNRVHRTRSNASKKGRNATSFHKLGENSFVIGLNSMNSMDLTEQQHKVISTPKQRQNTGFLNVVAMRSSQRASMPPAIDRNPQLQQQTQQLPQDAQMADPFERADELLLMNENELMLDADGDENLILDNNNYDDHSQSSFPPEFGLIEDKFQKSQLVVPSGPMIVEADREEDEEEKKVAENRRTTFRVPQKLHEFRKQAAAKEQMLLQQQTGKAGVSGPSSHAQTDLSMGKKQGTAATTTMSRQQQSLIKNATVKSKLTESLNQKKGNNLFGQRNTKKADVLPIAPPQLSRLEALALPKSRRPADQLEQILSPSQQNNGAGKDEKPRHMFRAQSNNNSKPQTNFNSLSNTAKEADHSQPLSSQQQPASSRQASRSPNTGTQAAQVEVSPRPRTSQKVTGQTKSIGGVKQTRGNASSLQIVDQHQQSSTDKTNKRQSSSPEPFQKRQSQQQQAQAYNERSTMNSTMAITSLGHRMTLLPTHNMQNQAAAKSLSARSNASRKQQSSLQLKAASTVQKKIKQIALYRDQQPILGLRKRHFTQAIQLKHNQYAFCEDEYDMSEQPLEKIVTIQCPICRRHFEQGVFGEIHNQKDLCRRVFVNKRQPFDSQNQRVAWDEEMFKVLSQAKSSINFSQRNKLNPSWQHKRSLFKKYSRVHQARTRAQPKNAEKIRLPVVYDPENPDELVPGAGHDDSAIDADHSLFMADLSLIHDQGAENFGVAASNTSRLRQSTSYADFDPGLQDSNSGMMMSGGDLSLMADVRVPCDFCGRKFNPEVSLKHIPICQRNYEKKHGPLGRRSTILQKKSANAL